MKKSAIISGVTGQDGSYLAELLLQKGYKVYGFKRRTSDNSLGNVAHIKDSNLEIVEGDLLDLPSLIKLCKLAKANEFYNLAAQSHVGSSFEQPAYTLDASGKGVLYCLEAIRESGYHSRFYQASTSELFGGQQGETFANEDTPFHPRSPYGCAKLYGFAITVNYREAYKMFACSGILFNHSSCRRGPNFVTRKITMGVANIVAGKQDKLYLGNLDSKRDWGHAADYVEGMWRMLNVAPEPKDYVLAMGETHSVREFCKIAFEEVNLNYKDYVEIDPRFYRPAEVDVLLGDSSAARSELGWKPTRSFRYLVEEMLAKDLRAVGMAG